jgi:outer membrane receptor protein involved in Fe transport
VGNPQLAPEIVDQVELTYNTFVKGISINLSTYYRQTSDVIEQFLDISENDQVSTTTFLNIGRNRSIGANFFTSVTMFKIWQLRGGINLYTYNSEGVIDGERLSNEALLWSGNLNSTISLKNDFRIEMFGFFRSPRQTLQGFNPSFSLFSIGARKEFNKRFSLGIQILQPFSDDKAFPSELSGPNFYQRSEFTIPFRSFGITVSYNFGKLNFSQQRRRGSSIDNDDLKGGEDNNF